MDDQLKEITRCNKCNEPLARFEGDKIYTLKRQGGEITEFEIEIIHGEDRGHLKLKCDKCGSNNFFTTRKESVEINDGLLPKLKKKLWKTQI